MATRTRAEKKKKSGSEKRSRGAILSVRVTSEEHKAITEKAIEAGLSVGGFLRACALRRVTPGTKRRAPVDHEILERTIAELRRVGNNINQMARAANMNQPIDSARLEHALSDYAATLQQLREARKG